MSAMSRADWMKLRLARDFHTGEYLYETNLKYRDDCQKAQLEMEAAELAAKAAKPQHVPSQESVARLSNLQARVNPKTGKRYFEENQQYREAVDSMYKSVYAGVAMTPEARAAIEATVVEGQS